jgi:PleD family two-component response regulator
MLPPQVPHPRRSTEVYKEADRPTEVGSGPWARYSDKAAVDLAHRERPPVILVANEHEWAARALETLLSPSGYAVVRGYSAKHALELVRSVRVDAVLVDAQMPDMDGAELCQRLRREPDVGSSTPLLVVASASGTRAERMTALEAGAWDVCTHPLDGESLLHKLRTFVASKRHADDLREQSLIDELTGFYNMRGIARRAREIGAEAFRRNHPLACVAFSPAWSTAGTDVAPESGLSAPLVTRLGAVCRDASRISDVFGRLGPTEFVVIAPATDGGGAVRLFERLQSAFAAQPILDPDPKPLRLRGGYYAVSDYTTSQLDAVDIMLRATTALRQTRRSGPAVQLTAFDA